MVSTYIRPSAIQRKISIFQFKLRKLYIYCFIIGGLCTLKIDWSFNTIQITLYEGNDKSGIRFSPSEVLVVLTETNLF